MDFYLTPLNPKGAKPPFPQSEDVKLGFVSLQLILLPFISRYIVFSFYNFKKFIQF